MSTLAELALAGRPLNAPVIDCHAHVGPSRGIDRPTSPDAIVHLMDRIMDSVTFRRRARQNVCCLVKHKKAAP